MTRNAATLDELLTPLPRLPALPRNRVNYAVDRWIDTSIVVGLMTIVGIVTGNGITRYPALNGDEGIYTSQAYSVLHGSLAPYTYTYDHPFFGWVQIAALSWIPESLHLGGQLSVINTRFVMLAFALANVALVYGICRRLDMPRWISGAGVLMFSLSPLTNDLTRQVYLDNVAITWVLLSFLLVLNRSRNQWVFATAGATFAIAVLSKETVVLLLPALAYLLYQRTVKHLRMMAFYAAGAMFSLLVLVYPLFAVLRHELIPGKGHVSLWGDGVMYQLASRSSSGAVWAAHSERRQLWDGWMQFDRVLVYAGIAAAVMCLASRRMRPFAVAVACAFAPIVKPGGYLPAMYIVASLPFLGICVAGVLARSWATLERWMNTRQHRWQWMPIVVGIFVLFSGSSLLAVYTGSHYADGNRVLLHEDDVKPYVQTLQWLKLNAAPVVINDKQITPTVLVDDAFSTDMYRMGFTPWNAVSYYKYDLDPSARQQLPGEWHDLNIVIDTPQMRGDIPALHLTRTQQALDHSVVLTTFGSGDSRIEIRQVNQ